MSSQHPIYLSRWLLSSLGTRMFVEGEDRIPQRDSVLVVSNHRSFMDAPALMAALDRPLRFACHHYMGEVPVMREIVTGMGCFPLDIPERRNQSFLRQGTELLSDREAVGVFPEGTPPMVTPTHPAELGKFHRGFAHLALQFACQQPRNALAVLPVALVSLQESNFRSIPVRLLSFFDPNEPMFDRSGLHPVVVYHHLVVAVGRPYWITQRDRQRYRGSEARRVVSTLAKTCRTEIEQLLTKHRDEDALSAL
ncbi:lysophospholipid acyltransferase family protein [Baaleninema sp.]|uniref:lysophospholipid acyltransferase family protein n=1 Tax=Baaleninema sp. TaxID=3101197 RepID=UPI003D024C96